MDEVYEAEAAEYQTAVPGAISHPLQYHTVYETQNGQRSVGRGYWAL